MKIRSLFAITAFMCSTPLWASSTPQVPDLRLTLAAPSGIHVYESGTYTYTVKNIGKKSAAGVKLVIDLPATGTSPQVYVLGTLGAYSTRCTKAGTRLTCGLNTLAKDALTTVFINLMVPYASAPMTLTAKASTTTSEPAQGNNTVTRLLNPATYPVTMSSAGPVANQHCTGSPTLTSFFECELFPSSITAHETVFNADNTIGFVGAPASFTGDWTYTPSENRLQFRYFDDGTQVAEFDGRGVGTNGVANNCFEGKTTFPNSTGAYISMYRICFP